MSWLRWLRKETLVEVPKIARLMVVPMRCRNCGSGLLDGEAVVWFERNDGQRSKMAHAECAVFIRRPDGGVERPSGAAASLSDFVAGALILTRLEYAHWLSNLAIVHAEEPAFMPRSQKDHE